MFTIIKYELEYHKKRVGLITALPILFLILISIHTDFNFEREKYARVLFPLLFGMLPIIIIAISWILSLKEYRVRNFIALPIDPVKIVIGRFFTVLIPLVYLILFGLLVQQKLNSEWAPIFERINYQYGAITHMIATLYFSYEVINKSKFKSDSEKILTGISIFIVSFAIIFIVDNRLWNQFNQSNIGLIYASTGTILFSLGCYIFTKRNNYLV
jgi:hypothetical protein